MEIWYHIWRENYAQTIVQFADNESISNSLCNAIQPKTYSFQDCQDNAEYLSDRSQFSNSRNSTSRISFRLNFQRCTIL